MISRRQFFAIGILILIICSAFMLTETSKEFLGDYSVNAYAQNSSDEQILSEDGTKLGTSQSAYKPNGNKKYYLYYGPEDTAMENTVQQWCGYRKIFYETTNEISSLKALANKSRRPAVIFVQGSALDSEETSALHDLVKKGINVVFCDIPATSVIRDNNDLLTMLGINSILKEDVDITGIHILNNVLLGGEKYYKTSKDDPKEAALMDLDLKVDWYNLQSGTKNYVVGLFDDDKDNDGKVDDDAIKNEFLPPICWRHATTGGYVFAVNGDYIKDPAGMGFLSAFMADITSFDLYPVINSQSVMVANISMFTDENSHVMMKTYNRDLATVLRDITWTGLSTVAERHNANMTCMITPQLDYEDDNFPTGDNVYTFLKNLRVQGAEAGLSTSQITNWTVHDKLENDKVFYDSFMPNYKLQSAYIEDYDPEQIAKELKNLGYNDIQCMVNNYKDDAYLVKYVDDIVSFTATNNGLTHTYSEDLRERSIETALAYSCIATDFKMVIYPTDTMDEWQNVYEQYSSNVNTYFEDYAVFEQTSLSEAQKEARKFFDLNYNTSLVSNKIKITTNTDEPTYYILRLHDAKVKKMTNGSFFRIDDDNNYLICVNGREANIDLKNINKSSLK